MILVVADTGPLNYLIQIGEAEVLPKLFERVVIPPAVLHELLDPGTPDLVESGSRHCPSGLSSSRRARLKI
jgi:predicted nucleic acid-binding protein